VRDIVVMLLIVALLGLGIRNAFNAMLLWAWSGFMALDNYMYGVMQSFPYGTTFALMAAALLLLRSRDLSYDYGKGGLTVLLLLMLIHCWIVGAAAYSGLARNAEYLENITKLVLYCLLLPLVLRSPMRIHALLWAICLGVGSHSALEGLKFILSGGGHIVRGLAKYGDNNHLAVVTAMLLPLLIYLRTSTSSRYIKALILASVLLLTISIIATYSRGGLIALTIFALWQVAVSRRKLLGLLLMLVAATVLLALAPERWESRMNTIADAGEDSSFQGRLAAWQISSAIALDHPLVGGGFHAVESGSVWTKYQNQPGLLGFLDFPMLDGARDGGKAAHSIYFEVLGDQGFVGIAIFLSVFAAGFYYALRLRRIGSMGGDSTRWATGLGTAIAGSLLVYMAGGAGVSMAYFELPYYLTTIGMICCRVVDARISKT
jgi:probable O-glycosylation ligase (exosortase A-associated)